MTQPTMVRFLGGLREFMKFAIVGGSGTVVNLIIMVVCNKVALALGTTADDAFVNLFGTRFNIRWYHVFTTIAFVVANTWNYQLNRSWTFRNIPQRPWLKGYIPFLLTGLGAYFVSMGVITLLMNPTSPLALPADVFDDSTGFRTRVYWAQAISIVVAMPVNFLLNKVWAFGRPKVKVVHSEVPTAKD